MDVNVSAYENGVHRYWSGPLMSPYVYGYELARNEMPSHEEVHLQPNGGVGLIINLGDSLTLGGQIIGKGIFLDGVKKKAGKVKLGTRPKWVRVSFKPGMFSLFFDVNLNRVNPGEVYPVTGKAGARGAFLDYLGALENDEAMTVAVESWLSCRMGPPTPECLLVLQAIHRIADSQFDARLEDLASGLGVESRRLQRLFGKFVGMSPKKLTKLMRLTAAKDLLSTENRLSCMDITYRCGYYDQAHFNREFKEVMGVTPSEYRRNRGGFLTSRSLKPQTKAG